MINRIRTTTASTPVASLQRGVALIEALVAIIIFTVGIIGLMGVQAASMRSVSDSKMRMDAAHLAQKLLAEMWAAPRLSTGSIDQTYITTAYSSPSGPAFARWRDYEVFNIDTSNATAPGSAGGLPGSRTNVPTVVFDAATNNITITVRWQAPSDPSVRQYVMRSNIY